MSKPRQRGRVWVAMGLLAAAGCGTTRFSDTTRTGTEQLLISHSIDDTVSNLDFRFLADRRVYLDTQYLDGVTDKGYLISSLRQQIVACGGLLQEERKTATYVVEARAGSVGTDRNDMLVGVPQTTVPSVMPGIPGGTIPEIALFKKTNRRAVAKIAVFAYNRVSGERVWQSGTVEAVTREQNNWLCGTGPFQRGTLIKGTELDDMHIVVPLLDKPSHERNYAVVSATQSARWKHGPLPESDPPAKARPDAPAGEGKVVQTSGAANHADPGEKSD